MRVLIEKRTDDDDEDVYYVHAMNSINLTLNGRNCSREIKRYFIISKRDKISSYTFTNRMLPCGIFEHINFNKKKDEDVIYFYYENDDEWGGKKFKFEDIQVPLLEVGASLEEIAKWYIKLDEMTSEIRRRLNKMTERYLIDTHAK